MPPVPRHPERHRFRMDRALAILAALPLVLASSCTSEPERRDLPDVVIDAPTSGPTIGGPAPTTPSDVEALGGRLAIIDVAGNLVTMSPDGSGEVVLDEAEPGRSEVRQPAWSPDGRLLAWVRVEVTEEQMASAVIATSTGEGARAIEASTEVVPFYLSWDPTSSRIAYLGSSAPRRIQLGILEAGGDAGTPIADGRPFYLSWAPQGDELLVHAGKRRLERLGLDGSLAPVVERPGTFTAPVWTDDGRTFVFASADADGQRLIVEDVGTGAVRPLVPYGELITFVVSPDGERIAFQSFGRDGSLPLQVIDVATGETVEVEDEWTPSFFWSPDGRRLLFMEPDPVPGTLWYRWGVWDGTSSFLTRRFLPSLLMVDQYLPFFEQYAQSMSLWSPDGSAFVYAGANEAGESGIWVQAARPDRAPVKVAEGDFVAWSPAEG